MVTVRSPRVGFSAKRFIKFANELNRGTVIELKLICKGIFEIQILVQPTRLRKIPMRKHRECPNFRVGFLDRENSEITNTKHGPLDKCACTRQAITCICSIV